jgi:serine/threonine-protein kinase
MERLRGDTLAQRLAQGPLPEAAAIELARRIAAGIRAAHAAGIVHRDLTPANIFLEGSGPKLVGFGGKELPGAVIGTPAYLAPEQLEGGTSDERSDVYALGCILFEMLAGRPPFTGEPAEILAAKLRDAPPPRAPALADLVASMLARRPDQRPSMSAVIAALEARPSTFDVVSAWILLALPVLLLIYAIVVAHQTAEDRPIKPPAPKQLR